VAAVPLQHPAPNAELSLATDASDIHIGGVMQQKSGDHLRPLGFFSHKLTDTESRYSTFDRELLAAHAAIKYFRHFCEGQAFQLWTDHKTLVTAISRVSAPISPRQQRHLAFISEFNVQMLYLPGLKNVADFCPAQIKQPLDQLPPCQRQTHWISKRWPPSKTVARNAAFARRYIP
jgi:cleavage and polyadenylation specificity factor subunit 1